MLAFANRSFLPPFSSAPERPFRPARETEPLTMVATGSLSSKNPASISELLDHGFYPGSLLNGEFPNRLPFFPPKAAFPGWIEIGGHACRPSP